MAATRGKTNQRPELAQPYTFPGTGDRTTAGAMLCLTGAPRPPVSQPIPAVDQTTLAALLCLTGAPRPLPPY